MSHSAYSFIKGLNGKPSAKIIREEYNRQHRNLLQSIRRMKNKGIDVSTFDIPKKPKRITEGSIRKIEKVRKEWEYETKRSGTSAIRKANLQYKKKQAMRRALEKFNENASKQIPNIPDSTKQKAKEWADAGIPDWNDTLVSNLEDIINDALLETAGNGAGGVSGAQQSYYAMVNRRAEIAFQRFVDVGTGEPENRKLYSWNLAQVDYMTVQRNLEAWIWYQSDGTYDYPNMQGLNDVIAAMTTTIKTPEWLKRQMADMYGEEDIADY